MQRMGYEKCCVGLHRFDADPGTNPVLIFNIDVDLDPYRTYPLRVLQMFEKKVAVIHSSAYLHCFYLFRQRHRCHNVQYFDQNMKFSGKKGIWLTWIRIRIGMP